MAAPRLVLSIAMMLVLTKARQQHPSISTATFVGNGLERQPPLVVLRAGASGEEPLGELKIFAEDPSWACKVRKSRPKYIIR